MRSEPLISGISKSRILGPLAPEIVTPDQFADLNYAPKAKDASERALMVAVLEDALEQWVKYACYPDAEKKVSWLRFRELQKWFESRDKSWLYYFERICETLDLDSDYLRRGLARAMQNPRQVQTYPRIRSVRSTHRISNARVRPTKKRGSKFTTFFVG